MTKKYYYLTHWYLSPDDTETANIKELGIYSSRESAENAINHYMLLSGFKDLPRKFFRIGECILDKDIAWTDEETAFD